LLDPEVVVRSDFMTVRGADEVGRQALIFSRGLTESARCALVNGAIGLVVAPRGRLTTVLSFKFAKEKIAEVRVFGDATRFHELELAVLDWPSGES
jgi:RNA polymerase sigma-70 factor (ECF subfamily)